jgi:glutamate carboxypeptidase
MRFVCVSDEEVGSPTSQALFEQLAPHLTEALVFEAGRKRDQIVTRRKGGGVFTLTVHGRAAHAGADHASGVNAIHGLARLIPRIEALTDPGRGVTLNVGLIEGGTAKNTVPDRAQCVIDARFCTREDADAVGEELQRIATDPFGDDPDAPERLRAIRVELGGGVTRPPMEADAASTALRTRYEACASAVGLETGEAPLQGGGSDANLLSAAGVPSIDGLGPYGELFHNPGEWSSLSSLERRTKALALYLERSLER